MSNSESWYTVYFYNFDMFAQEQFDTAEKAKKYGKSKGFEFYVVQYINKEWVRA